MGSGAEPGVAAVPNASAGPFPRLRARLQRVGDFFAKQRHLVAIRDGVVGALPIVLTGSVFLLLAQPPSRVLQEAVAPWVPTLLTPYRALGGAIAVYVTFCCAYSLARSYKLDAMAAALLALAAYLVAALPTGVTPVPGVPALPPGLPIARLGAGGIFAGILLAIFAVELTRVMVTRNWTIRLPASAPEVVVRSFVALFPALFTLTIVFLVVHVLRFDVIAALEHAAKPLLVVTGSFIASLVVVAIDSSLWLLGVHASAALATLRPLWEAMLTENQAVAATGAEVLPHIASQHFYLWFVWQGGSGATLSLAILLWRAKSAQLRNVGRVGFVPALCNINEPILFGAPVVLNPLLAVPFLLVPMITAAVAYSAFALNWVTRPYLETAWTLPAPIGAFLTTGGDYRAVLLQMLNLGLGVLVYWPFVRRYDRRLLARETEAAASGAVSSSVAPGTAR